MGLSMPQNKKGNAMNKESENEEMREKYDMDDVLASISPTRDMIDPALENSRRNERAMGQAFKGPYAWLPDPFFFSGLLNKYINSHAWPHNLLMGVIDGPGRNRAASVKARSGSPWMMLWFSYHVLKSI